MRKCNDCVEQERETVQISMTEWAFEAHEARHERQLKRMWLALFAAIVLLFASNVGWLIYESQFDTLTYDIDGEGINNVNYGAQGDLNNGDKSENQNKKSDCN